MITKACNRICFFIYIGFEYLQILNLFDAGFSLFCCLLTNVAGSQPPNKLLDMHLTMGTFTASDNNHSDAKIPQSLYYSFLIKSLNLTDKLDWLEIPKKIRSSVCVRLCPFVTQKIVWLIH